MYQQQQQLLQRMNGMNGLNMMNGTATGHHVPHNHTHNINLNLNLNSLNNLSASSSINRSQQQQQQQQPRKLKQHNNNNKNNNISYYDVERESGIKNRLPNLRYHVFISKETTKELSDYILPEPWGEENGLLYKYLDYVWRCQLFDCEIKKFYCRNERKLVFHSGLQRRSDGEFVYLLLIANDADTQKKVDQKWRVALGIQNGLHSRNMSFVTKEELLKHYWPNTDIGGDLLPQRTLFYGSEKDLIFNRHYRFEIDWEERLRTCKNRIYKALSNDGNRKGRCTNIDESVLPLSELQRRFATETSKSILLCRGNPRIGVPQAFIESKNGGYRLELLIPLTLYFANKYFYFALALRPHHEEQIYEGMSILTREMAYANARLVGSIDSGWLLFNSKSQQNNKHSHSAHCSCTCHTFCSQGINPMTIHNVADHKRKYQNDIPHDNTKINNIKKQQHAQQQTIMQQMHMMQQQHLQQQQQKASQNIQNLYQNNTQNRIYYAPSQQQQQQQHMQPQPPRPQAISPTNNPFQSILTPNYNTCTNQLNLSSILSNPSAFITSVPNTNQISPTRAQVSRPPQVPAAILPFINTNINANINANVHATPMHPHPLTAYLQPVPGHIATFGPLPGQIPVAPTSGPQSFGSSGSQLGGSLPSSVPIHPLPHAYNINKPPQLQQMHSYSSATTTGANTATASATSASSITKSLSGRNSTKIGKIEEENDTNTAAAVNTNNNNNDNLANVKAPAQTVHVTDAKPVIKVVNKLEDNEAPKAPPKAVPSITIPVNTHAADDIDGDDTNEDGDSEGEDDGGKGGGGFTDDMFADASPRTKEVFTGLRFDDYSLDESKSKNKMSRAKSYACIQREHEEEHTHQSLYKYDNKNSASFHSLQCKANGNNGNNNSNKLPSVADTHRSHTHDGVISLPRTQSEHRMVTMPSHRFNFKPFTHLNSEDATPSTHDYHYYHAPHTRAHAPPPAPAPIVPPSEQYNYYAPPPPPPVPAAPHHGRMTKSHSQPSLTDMMSMRIEQQQFQQLHQQYQEKQAPIVECDELYSQ